MWRDFHVDDREFSPAISSSKRLFRCSNSPARWSYRPIDWRLSVICSASTCSPICRLNDGGPKFSEVFELGRTTFRLESSMP
jgi:hypothetical protein